MNPTVTVVIPAYNAERFLRATLESLRAQTFRDFQTVVVDDGSTDNTSGLVREYPEVRLVTQPNAGVAAARNRGVRETRSEWVAFLDADDLWMPEKLRLQTGAAHSGDAGAIFCETKRVDDAGNEIQEPERRTSLEMEPLLLHDESILQDTSSTLLVRRSVFESVGGYDEALATMADWDLLIRLRQVTTFANLPVRLAAYRRYPGTMSRSVAMLERESLLILDKVFRRNDLPETWRRMESKSRAWNDLVLSGSHLAVGHALPALRFGLRAVARNPRLLGRVLGLPLRRASGLLNKGR